MADFDERALREPRQAVDSIRTADLSPWMVWTAAGAIGGMALLGVWFGIRGAHPMSGVGLPFNPGVAVSPAAAASATPAVALPKDQQWSTLSGPQVLPPSAAPAKVASAAEAASDEDHSAEPAAASAAEDQDENLQASQPPPEPATPTQTPSSAPSQADSDATPW